MTHKILTEIVLNLQVNFWIFVTVLNDFIHVHAIPFQTSSNLLMEGFHISQ